MSKAKTLLELINLLGKEANKETPSDSEQLLLLKNLLQP